MQSIVELRADSPEYSLFRDDLVKTTYDKVQDKNEARVIRSITPYIVPSVEDLETLGATYLEHLIEGVNEGWIGSIPVEGPRPQPDYSIGGDPHLPMSSSTSLIPLSAASMRSPFSSQPDVQGQVWCRGT